ncbi:MAG: hypothetical protein SH850_22845 [Planctomycetaceae bacterium]|nr:hypothetical protein [Planctomycetaceae bacterium]
MTRMQTAAASLVAAIPAALLAALLAMAFLNHSESLKGMVMVLVGTTLACAALVAAMPFGILIFTGKKKAKADVSASQANPTVVVDGDEEEGMSTGDDIVTADDEEPTEEISETVDFDSAELSDVVDTELDDDLSDEDLFGDDEPPKKKKKKK